MNVCWADCKAMIMYNLRFGAMWMCLRLTKADLSLSSCTSKINLWQNQCSWEWLEVARGCSSVISMTGWNIPGMSALALSPRLCFQPATNIQRILLDRHPEGLVTGLESALTALTSSAYSSHYLYVYRGDELTHSLIHWQRVLGPYLNNRQRTV